MDVNRSLGSRVQGTAVDPQLAAVRYGASLLYPASVSEARVPDEVAAPTVTSRSFDLFRVTTQNNGAGAFAESWVVRPSPTGFVAKGATFVAGIPTVVNFFNAAQQASYVSNYSFTRLVSLEITLTNKSPALTKQGKVFWLLSRASTDPSTLPPNTIMSSALTNSREFTPDEGGNSWTFTWLPNSPQDMVFITPGSSVSAANTQISFYIEGATAQEYEVKIVGNWEHQVLAAAAALFNPQLCIGDPSTASRVVGAVIKEVAANSDAILSTSSKGRGMLTVIGRIGKAALGAAGAAPGMAGKIARAASALLETDLGKGMLKGIGALAGSLFGRYAELEPLILRLSSLTDQELFLLAAFCKDFGLFDPSDAIGRFRKHRIRTVGTADRPTVVIERDGQVWETDMVLVPPATSALLPKADAEGKGDDGTLVDPPEDCVVVNVPYGSRVHFPPIPPDPHPPAPPDPPSASRFRRI